jgi:hypothetical protein
MNSKDRWKNRRRMAWMAFWAGVLFPLLLWLTDSDQIGAVAGPFFLFVGSVVGAYIGFATLDDKWQHEAEEGEQDANWPKNP